MAWSLLATGCAVGPDFVRPTMELPATWSGAAGGESGDEALRRWWDGFNDPQLTSLIERAMAANLDLRKAAARVRQARASRGVAISEIGPTVDAAGSHERSRSSAGVVGDLYQAGFDAGWEIDLFGGTRRGIEAAEAELAAAVEGKNGVLVSLSAEVARNYISLRVGQQRLAVARQNMAAQQKSVAITRQRYEAGLVNRLDLSNAEAQLATTAAQVPPLESAVRQSMHALALLLALPPATLVTDLTPEAPVPVAAGSVPAGLPSDLLRRRPDIRKAEAALHAATARIGVATADLFPRFTLSGALSFSDTHLGSLFTWAERGWSFGPSVSWRLFETGRALANIELRKAMQEEEGLAYQQTVLVALREVEDALVAAGKEEEHRQALLAAVTANRRAVDLATRLYTAGESDFLAVVVAQRSLYAAEDALAQSTGTVATELVALYKALGGGWEAVVPEGRQ
ncbi:MAG TPA: efflux transporter outer membrane subunit [Desulfurivibrionaceae bacterium]|nr:efflux transporter outer membrane subunit [Desulfurivibrionaceae bacterium]